MLNSTADYKCVDVTGLEGFITGNPMPKRDNKGDGSWRAMKYEDLLFLQEAKAERINWKEEPSSKSNPKGRNINRNAFKDVAITENIGTSNPLTTDGGDFISNEVDLSWASIADYDSGTFYIVKDAETIEEVFGELSLEQLSDDGRNCDADEMRTAYYNIKNIDRTLTRAEEFFTNVVATYKKWDTDFTPDPDQTYQYGDCTMFPAYWVGSWRHTYPPPESEVCVSAYEQVSYGIKDPIAEWKYAEDAALVLLMETAEIKPSGTTSKHKDVVVFPCTIEDGTISIDSINLTDVVKAVLGQHGETFIDYPPPRQIGLENNLGVWVRDVAVVADHVFPAEIDSLNWNWQP